MYLEPCCQPVVSDFMYHGFYGSMYDMEGNFIIYFDFKKCDSVKLNYFFNMQ